MSTDAGAQPVHHWPQIDTTRPQFVLCVGRKHSGKSNLAAVLYQGWGDVDRLCIDVTGDALVGPDAVRVSEPPGKMPARGDDGKPVNIWYVADPGSPTYQDDLDKALGAGLFPKDRRKLVWIDELAEQTTATYTGPRMRRLLLMGRHHYCSLIMCCPRPMHINALCIAQADRIFIFDVPNVDDRKKLADTMGWPFAKFEAAYHELTLMPEYSYLMFVTKPRGLFLCPPLPTSPAAA